MIGNVTTALQAFATTGNGVTTLVLTEPRLVTFKIAGNGNVTAGAVTIEWAPMSGNTPMLSSGGWTALTTIPVPANTTTEWFAGAVSGTFRARISQNVTGGSVTVLAVRPEEQRGPAKFNWPVDS